MKMFVKIVFIFITLINLNSFAQFKTENIPFTGYLPVDAELISEKYSPSVVNVHMPSSEKKSVFLAGLMSLVVPGTGEIYAGDYLKAGIFMAVEAAVITTALIYDKKGDDQTDKFEGYADENWSVVKYAKWLNTHRNAQIAIDETTPGLKPWERVDWNQLHIYESEFSHKLPNHGDQQYYELIGKYQQYSGGWNDFDPNDPEFHNLSPNFLFYSSMRGEANDLYNIASKAVIGLYINHFLSMLDAAWSVINYNKDIAMNVRFERTEFADHSELIPTLNLKFSF